MQRTETRNISPTSSRSIVRAARSFHASLRLCLASSTCLVSSLFLSLSARLVPPGLASPRLSPHLSPFHAVPSPMPEVEDAEGGINWRGARSLMISPRSRRRSSFGNRPCIYLRPYARTYVCMYRLRPSDTTNCRDRRHKRKFKPDNQSGYRARCE